MWSLHRWRESHPAAAAAAGPGQQPQVPKVYGVIGFSRLSPLSLLVQVPCALHTLNRADKVGRGGPGGRCCVIGWICCRKSLYCREGPLWSSAPNGVCGCGEGASLGHAPRSPDAALFSAARLFRRDGSPLRYWHLVTTIGWDCKTDKTKLFSTGAMMLRCCQTKFRDINRDCFREAEAL